MSPPDFGFWDLLSTLWNSCGHHDLESQGLPVAQTETFKAGGPGPP